MKYVLCAAVIAFSAVALSTAEAKSHKIPAPQAEDRLMYANPNADVPDTPTFHWSGRSSWGDAKPYDPFTYNNEN